MKCACRKGCCSSTNFHILYLFTLHDNFSSSAQSLVKLLCSKVKHIFSGAGRGKKRGEILGVVNTPLGVKNNYFLKHEGQWL